MTFCELLDSNELLTAMVHVGFCEEQTCDALDRELLEHFLNENRRFSYEILRALVFCRAKLSRKRTRGRA